MRESVGPALWIGNGVNHVFFIGNRVDGQVQGEAAKATGIEKTLVFRLSPN